MDKPRPHPCCVAIDEPKRDSMKRSRHMTFLLLVLAVSLPIGHGLGQNADALFTEGSKYFKARDYKAAVEKLRVFCSKAKIDPRLPQAKLMVGDSLLGLGMLMQATETYKEWLKEFPHKKEARDLRLKYARCFEAIGEWDKAIA